MQFTEGLVLEASGAEKSAVGGVSVSDKDGAAVGVDGMIADAGDAGGLDFSERLTRCHFLGGNYLRLISSPDRSLMLTFCWTACLRSSAYLRPCADFYRISSRTFFLNPEILWGMGMVRS